MTALPPRLLALNFLSMKNILLRLVFFFALIGSALAAPNAYFTATASSTALLVKIAPSSGYGVRLDSINAANANSTQIFIQFFDSATAGAVTPGTTAPLFVLGVPANGVIDKDLVNPFYFFKGMVYCVTTTASGNTAPSSSTPVTITYE